jgi:hypothetical protein
MATFLDFVERIVNAVYGTPNPQVQTYFRDLRVEAAPPIAEDDDSNYHYKPERNGEPVIAATVGPLPASAAAPKLSSRNSAAVPGVAVPSE